METDYLESKNYINYLLMYKDFFEDITGRLNKIEPINAAYLDSQKAFDQVQHKELLHKSILLTCGVKNWELSESRLESD